MAKTTFGSLTVEQVDVRNPFLVNPGVLFRTTRLLLSLPRSLAFGTPIRLETVF